ncbi:MAG: hypothetical protein OHK0039_40340 [Bacteroidia bacterium]
MRLPLLSLFSLLLFSCSSYPEGPIVSPFPATDRIVNTWTWSYALEDGVNETGPRADSLLILGSDQTAQICDKAGNCRNGTWNFVQRKTKLQFIFDRQAIAYDILMLKQSELWLSYEADSQSVLWELVPVE